MITQEQIAAMTDDELVTALLDWHMKAYLTCIEYIEYEPKRIPVYMALRAEALRRMSRPPVEVPF